MSYSGSDWDASPIAPQKYIEKEILDTGETLESFSDFTASLPLYDEEEFQNLMNGPKISFGVNVIVGDIADNDINVALVDST